MKAYLKQIYFKLIKFIFDLIYGKLKLTDKNHYISDKIKINKLSLNDKSKKKYSIYNITNCRIYSDLSENVAVIHKNYILDNISLQLSKNRLLDVSKNAVFKTGTRKLIQKNVKGRVLSLVQGVTAINNYGHWLLDIIPKLIISKKQESLNNFDRIYVPNIKRQFQKDILMYFNIDPEKIIDGSEIRHLKANEIVIPKHPYWELNEHQLESVARIDQDMIYEIRQLFLKHIKHHNIKNEKIFIDRSDSTFNHNQIQNYIEITDILKKFNFKTVKLSNFSFDEQIELFFNAKEIIGAHGAGLTNTIFCKPGTKIIEFNTPTFKCDLFKNISKINNLNYNSILSEELKLNFKGDINVSSQKLIHLLEI
jgi:capsular polysaccharide biosynthesis protein